MKTDERIVKRWITEASSRVSKSHNGGEYHRGYALTNEGNLYFSDALHADDGIERQCTSELICNIDEMLNDLKEDIGNVISIRNLDLFKRQGGHFWSNDWNRFKSDVDVLVDKDNLIAEYKEELISEIDETIYNDKGIKKDTIFKIIDELWAFDEAYTTIEDVEENDTEIIKMISDQK